MSLPKTPPPGILFTSVLYRKGLVSAEEIKKIWSDKYGEYEYFEHPHFPMKRYYSKEMGPQEDMARFFLVSHELRPRETLVEHKKWCLERESSDHDARKINWDAGFLTLENLQLATCKNFSHRVFIKDNIYSDLTLIYHGTSFQTLPWSYPDYSHPEIIDFFNKCRDRLHRGLKAQNLL